METKTIFDLSAKNPKRSGKTTGQIVELIRELFLLLVAVLCLFPLLWMFSTSLKSTREAFTGYNLIPRVWRFDNYVNAWQQADFSLYFLNSIIYTTVVMLGVWLVATLGAYGFARLAIPGKKVIFYLLVGSLMVPIPGSFIPLYVMMNQYHLAGTRLGYILPMISGGLATAIFILKSFFESIPKEFEESSRIDGCSKPGIFFRIMIPLSRPAWLTAMIFTALATWNDYFWAVIMFNKKELMPIQVGLKVFQGQYFTKYEMVMAGTAIAAIPVILLYVVFQKYIVSGITAGGIKG